MSKDKKLEEQNNEKALEMVQESGDNTAIAATNMQTAVATLNGERAFVTQLIDAIKADFLAVNDGLNLDFVYTASWLTVNKKGNFVEKDDDDISYGESVEVVIGQGEQRYMLWGKDGTAEKGQMLAIGATREEAEAALVKWQEAHPDRAHAYEMKDIGLRYLAYVIPVESLGKDDELPKIYLMSFAPTSSITWGKYAFKIYNGGYKKTLDIPARTGVNRVVTKIRTVEVDQKGTDNSFIGLEFEALGIFKPEDYGVDTNDLKQKAADAGAEGAEA